MQVGEVADAITYNGPSGPQGPQGDEWTGKQTLCYPGRTAPKPEGSAGGRMETIYRSHRLSGYGVLDASGRNGCEWAGEAGRDMAGQSDAVAGACDWQHD